MDLPNYDGNIHPDEWINNLQKYFNLRQPKCDYLNIAKSLVNPDIKLPTGINEFEELRNALKEDIFFTLFKNTNKRKLQSLKYIPEREGGDTSKFISDFCKLCYNADINDIEEQKIYLYQSLPDNEYYSYFLTDFYEKVKNVNSINELVKEFGEVVTGESNIIRDGSIVALKHVATGKYISSIENLHYTTGTKTQLVFAGSTGSGPGSDSLWKIKLVTTDSYINLQHVKSGRLLGVYCCHDYHYSPSKSYTEVSCAKISNHSPFLVNWNYWNYNHSKLENQGYLKSDDIINLSIKRRDNGKYELLRSHNIQFTVKDGTFQEVFCHSKRLGGNDKWCIELIK